MKVLLFTCSDLCLLEARTNVVSLINILEEVSAPAFPVMVPRLAVSGFVEREETEPDHTEIVLKIFIEDTLLIEKSIPVSFQGLRRVRSLTELQGFIIPSAGMLKFLLFIDEKELAAWDVSVTLFQQNNFSEQEEFAWRSAAKSAKSKGETLRS